MAQSFFPFDAGAGANVTEDQWAKMGALWLPSGVARGALAGNLAVIADGTARAVTVAAGRAWHSGFFYENDGAFSVPIDAADATNPRIDRVVLRLDRGANTILVAVIKGTPATTPAVPALTNTATVIDLPLAQVRVDAGATTITAANVKDERYLMSSSGGYQRAATTTAVSNIGSAKLDILTVTRPSDPTRRLRLSMTAAVSASDADAEVIIRFRDATADNLEVRLFLATPGPAGRIVTVTPWCTYTPPAAGHRNYVMSIERGAGTGFVHLHSNLAATEFVIEDIGAA